MGPGGEASRELSSVKVMKPTEFKRWFLRIMHNRERRAVESLVDNETTLNIGLDASANFLEAYKVVREGDEEYTFPLEALRLQDIGVHSSFTVPLPKLGKMFEAPIPTLKQLVRTESEGDGEGEIETTDSWTDAIEQNVPRLSIHGGVSGELDQGFAILPRAPKHQTEDGSPFFDQFYSMTTQQLALGVKLEHSFPEIHDDPNEKKDTSTPSKQSLASLLQGTNVDISADLLPHPSSFSIGIGKAVQFISESRPFYIQTRAVILDSPSIKPPELQVTVTRNLGVTGNKTAFMQWHSGESEYPALIRSLLTRGETPNLNYLARWLTTGQAAPVMAMGMLFHHATPNVALEADEPVDEEDIGSANSSKTKTVIKAFKTHVDFELSHSFDIFARFDTPPIRSQIRNDGDAEPEFATPILRKSRGVRVEVAANVGLPVTFDASITGKRKFGTFTTVGFGVGVNALGLHCSLSWQRLGQSISVPIALLPLESTTSTAVVLAVTVPWATCTALEFLWLRPRDKRHRHRLIKSQRKKLRANIAKRKAEAEEAVALMYESVQFRQAREAASGGLVILSATYGAKEKDGKWKAGASADVTVALAALVDNGQLSLARGMDKSRLIGFYDPCPLERKVLEVAYEFGGKEHRVEVRGGQSLVLPKRAHEV